MLATPSGTSTNILACAALKQEWLDILMEKSSLIGENFAPFAAFCASARETYEMDPRFTLFKRGNTLPWVRAKVANDYYVRLCEQLPEDIEERVPREKYYPFIIPKSVHFKGGILPVSAVRKMFELIDRLAAEQQKLEASETRLNSLSVGTPESTVDSVLRRVNMLSDNVADFNSQLTACLGAVRAAVTVLA